MLRKNVPTAKFLDDFVSEIEVLGCYCGGGALGQKVSLVIELGRTKRVALKNCARLVRWLVSRGEVKKISIGALVSI